MASPPPAAAQRFTKMFDQNGDGKMTVADFDAIFKAADKNKDGKLETSELGGRAMMRFGPG
jgi:Ca2+-binding EF-hand superfamily protein